MLSKHLCTLQDVGGDDQELRIKRINYASSAEVMWVLKLSVSSTWFNLAIINHINQINIVLAKTRTYQQKCKSSYGELEK